MTAIEMMCNMNGCGRMLNCIICRIVICRKQAIPFPLHIQYPVDMGKLGAGRSNDLPVFFYIFEIKSC